MASWSPDDGSARTGLHVSVTDDHGRNWLLPVSRAEATAMIAELTRRCPQGNYRTRVKRCNTHATGMVNASVTMNSTGIEPV